MRRSLKHPVVVELYSPRVATGQQLSDALAALAAEAEGRFLLARVNVDAAPQIVQALQLQAVPTVHRRHRWPDRAAVPGRAGQGAGAAAYIDQLLKAAVANGIVGRAEPVAAARRDRRSRPRGGRADPRFAAADEALERGDFAAARDEFDRLLQANPNDAEARPGRPRLGCWPGPTAWTRKRRRHAAGDACRLRPSSTQPTSSS